MMPLEEAQDDRLAWRNGLMLALLIWLLAGLLYKQPPDLGANTGDLSGAFDAARLLRAHKSIYLHGYADPPLLPTLLRLVARVPAEYIGDTWRVLCVASLLTAVGSFASAAGFARRDAAPLGILLIVGFHFHPTVLDFTQHQMVMPVLALLCAGYMADSNQRMFRLATCIALAALIKLWMLALLIYLLFRRRVLPFFWGLLLFGGCMAGLLARVGWKEGIAYWQIIQQHLNGDLAFDFRNQSILGFVRVHFGLNAAAVPLVDSQILLVATAAIGMIVVVCGLAYAFRVEQPKKPEQRRLCMSLTVVSLLLATPICQRHSLVLLLPAIWTLLACEQVPVISRLAGVIAYGLLTFSFAAPNRELSGLATLPPSAYFFAAILIWLALLAAATQREQAVTYVFDPVWE